MPSKYAEAIKKHIYKATGKLPFKLGSFLGFNQEAKIRQLLHELVCRYIDGIRSEEEKLQNYVTISRAIGERFGVQAINYPIDGRRDENLMLAALDAFNPKAVIALINEGCDPTVTVRLGDDYVPFIRVGLFIDQPGSVAGLMQVLGELYFSNFSEAEQRKFKSAVAYYKDKKRSPEEVEIMEATYQKLRLHDFRFASASCEMKAENQNEATSTTPLLAQSSYSVATPVRHVSNALKLLEQVIETGHAKNAQAQGSETSLP